MADQTKDTERKIREEDEKLRQRQQDTTGQDRPDVQKGTSGTGGGETQFAQGTTGGTTSGAGGAQGAGTGGTIGGQSGDNEMGAQGGGFVGSEGEESGEYLQKDEPQQAGFAEQGRGAPEEGRDIERGGERTANLDSDIEGSSENR